MDDVLTKRLQLEKRAKEVCLMAGGWVGAAWVDQLPLLCKGWAGAQELLASLPPTTVSLTAG